VAGAPCPVVVGGRPEAPGVALRVPAGVQFALGPPALGLRSYLAVRGGLAVAPVRGSRSRDTGAALGPAPLAAGDVLPVGVPVAGSHPWYGPVPSPGQGLEAPAVVELVPGPHDEVADPAGAWVVGQQSDRVGVRLVDPPGAGRRLSGAGSGSVPSFPVLPGSVQLTPAGELVVLGPDAGVTGGYPVLGVVTPASLDRLAQCRPGERVTLRPRTRRSPGRRAGAP
jgi:allophanate hydrolase subunit 2